MLDPNFKLTVLFDDNGSFTEYTNDAFDYGRDSFTETFVSAEDKLYFGFEKPINAVYIEMSTPNENAADLTLEFYNGSSWVSAANFYDDTNGLNRSGFLKWGRNQTDEEEVAVNSVTKFFYRLSLSADSTAIAFDGISLVFSDDQDLKNEFFQIDRFIPTGQNSHILHHVSARNEIIQKLRRDGRSKVNLNSGIHKGIGMWDILEFEQIRQASTFLALSKIFMNRSDRPDDIYAVRAAKFMESYNRSIDLFFLDIDYDDDGLHDRYERLGPATGIMVRR